MIPVIATSAIIELIIPPKNPTIISITGELECIDIISNGLWEMAILSVNSPVQDILDILMNWFLQNQINQ